MKTKIFVAEPSISEADVENVSEAIRSGWISGRGPYVEKFEREFAKWAGTKYGIATTSGTSALHLALATLGIDRDEEVIIPTLTMGAVPFSVSYTGAKATLVDSEDYTWNMDPNEVESKITKKTKAIVVVHLYGHPVDMDPILETASKYDIPLIEDAAEAHGAEYKGRKVGSFGRMACFSFYANKIITCGEGGMIVTNDPDLAEKAKKLKNMAFEKDPTSKFLHKSLGYNYRLTNIQAALGLSQLGKIESFIELRRRNAKLYNELLKDLGGISLPPEAEWAKNVYWMYSILIDEKQFGISRDELIHALLEKYGVETRPFFVPVNRQPIYEKLYSGERYPVAEQLSLRGLNLPSGNTLTEDQIREVVAAIKAQKKRKG
ncbi:MAG: DegT/DnrJ/EryC1/StrS family aminotransferase [Candidatus Geothermarchaeales archaeon]